MRYRPFAIVLAALASLPVMGADAQDVPPQADFLFVGSYHMNNPGRDVHNLEADDVLSERRQAEIAEVVRLVGRYRPTKVMIEAGTQQQEAIHDGYVQSCRGSRPLAGSEHEQLGFRIACAMGLETVHAVDWDALVPITDPASIDYLDAVERHGQQAQYEAFLASGRALNDEGQELLGRGSVRDMLEYLNSDRWLRRNARTYYEIGLFGTQDDPVGASWVQYWFGRNLAIFNGIARRTDPGDRVLVVYGAGHGNHLRQLASDSGLYRVHDPVRWLSEDESR